ncbi:MAG TPA: proline--tRNA ligase [Cyanobacteria bacterium UBA11159]|nr:proline--tRNA ligase [Cyanobacteria bacterium UBA11367]HBE61078.1 proline--tRNA ligase [Cyanobacteria bacterium UBA11366]HBR74264.1 proline--tRNA ligase [Cyanobacteria bacterium UBA11159]HBS68371.1 proline--tRNA ligase [Cyanobacteria bacterium UBA11153]HCA95003.1 proline--tRNA ligase [Cyanobacteria bacterium UBA9226]
MANEKADLLKITKRDEDYSRWYLDIVDRAKLAEESGIRGCMVIRPEGFAIWEKMQQVLDGMFKATGHTNAYFPLFIPVSYFSKEAKHVSGFAKECAVVTHHRLQATDSGEIVVDPEAELAEPLVVRPTSETIIWSTYRKWIQSYRDLPILLNQWVNVCRWELRTRPFLRTTEFLWQEGHTAHATFEEAEIEAKQMLEVYKTFVEDYLAIPVFAGKKTENEKFPGAEYTYTIETMTQDKRAIQVATSHHLGTTFSQAFDVKYLSPEGTLEYPFATSWGITTRLIGTLIMVHSDDQGFVCPPRIAPLQVIGVPIFRKDAEKDQVLARFQELQTEFQTSGSFSFKIDARENLSPGFKFNDWELKGIPLRLEIGPRDLKQGKAVLVRRDTGEKLIVEQSELLTKIPSLLEEIHRNLFAKAQEFQHQNTYTVSNYEEFKEGIENQAGFYLAYFDGTPEDEDKIKEDTKATGRCIPLNQTDEEGECFYTGRKTKRQVIFARAY